MARCESSARSPPPFAAEPSAGRAPPSEAGRGIRTVVTTTPSTTNITASIRKSIVKLAGRLTSTSCPPTSPPRPSPRFCRKNCVAKARVRVAVLEHQTSIVARAGCMTAVPAPSTAADSTAAGTLLANPRAAAPTEARTEATASTGNGPRRSMARPVNGRTASAAIAKAARTTPAVPAPRSCTCAT